MKLIIDIPEKVVTAIRNAEDYRYDIHTAIAQGMPYDETPRGEWIYERPNGKTYSDFVYCSECQRPNGFYKTNFCPNCGADMRGDKMINEESLKAWEHDHIEFLTSREMGEWLYRRDKNRDKKERLQGELIKKSDVIRLLEQWADGYSYIEIPTTDAIKAIKDMGGDKNV